MESTVLSLGKSVLDGALSYAKSAVAEEVALQLRVRRDQFFITNELEMMQAFLMVAHDEGDNNDNKVVKVWVKQVRDVAYDVEDCLLDLAVRLERQSWWHIGRTLLDRRHVAKQMKELRANVEDVSQRNLRYNLIKGPKPTEQSAAITGATVIMSATDEARRQRDEANLILVRLITDNKDSCLKVISVWGKGSTGDLAHASIIKRAHEYIKIQNKFECQAFIGLVRPFSLTEFLQDVVQQFYTNSLQGADESEEKVNLRAQVLKMMGMAKGDDLALELKKYLTEKSYLIVLTDINTMEEWERVKTCFPDNKKGSRIIVSTEQVGVASLCVGADNGTPEHKQLFADQTLHVFYKKGSHDGPYSTEAARSTSKPDNTSGSNSSSSKMFDRTQTMLTAIRESEFIGREKEKTDIIKLITNKDERQECEVISLWGMGGLGKTTLVRDVYQSQELSGKFEKRACATIMHPFNQNELLRNLATQLGCDQADLIKHLEGKKYLIVLDDLLSNTEWDTIIPYIPANRTSSRIIVTTRLKDIAKHVSKKLENVYELRVLEHKNARDLFVEKVFKNHTNLDEKYPELVEPANLILKKCNGLPLAIVTIGGFLSNQPKTPLEWRKLNEHISVELEMNPELETIRTILMKSYDGLPYHLKACFLYLSIFPEDYELGIKRLLRRWIAEGYSSVVRNQSALEMANSYLMELIGRSMLLSFYGGKKIVSCQVHDLIREICISKSMEENLVLRLDESCSSLNTKQRTSRHLSINGNWQGDKRKFESMVDMARVRSVTMFGKWRPYFISDKMRMLRVLDLEDTTGLVDHHLEHVWKLLHLRYLSLKGCRDIYHLPDSLGNLAQLETLDIRSTSIVMLPKAITKLGKLQYLHAGAKREHAVGWRYTLDRSCPLLTIGPQLCAACCVPQLLDIDGFNRRDVCTFACCAVIPCIIKKLNHGGVMLPRGSRKLKALQTLRDVDLVSGDNSILHDIKRLTGLRKLGLMSITKENGPEVFSVVSHLSHLQTLMVKSYPGFLYLGDTCSPPKDLHSLKLRGTMEKLPGWIKELHNLVKLELSLQLSCQSEHDAAIQVLGNLPNLSFLCLQASPSAGKELHFRSETFGSLGVLKLGSLLGTESVRFEQGAMPKLEQLKYWGTRCDETVFSGLQFLSSIKTVVVDLEFRADSDQRHGVVERVKKQIQEQLALNTNADKIILKLDVKVNTL